MKKIIAAFLLAGVAGLAVAAQPVQESKVTTADGKVVAIVTDTEGGIAVTVTYTGAEAVSFLSNIGVEISVSSEGVITSFNVAPSVTVVQAPVAAAAAPAAAQQAQSQTQAPAAEQAEAAAPAPSAPVFAGSSDAGSSFMPDNSSAVGGMMNSGFVADTGSNINSAQLSGGM